MRFGYAPYMGNRQTPNRFEVRTLFWGVVENMISPFSLSAWKMGRSCRFGRATRR